MRVLTITESYAPHVGGLETCVAALTRCQRAAGHTPLVLTDRLPRSLPARELQNGVAVWRVAFPGRAVPPRATLAGLATAWPALRRFRPDLIHLHFLGRGAWLALALRTLWRVPLVVTLHGEDIQALAERPPVRRWLAATTLLQAAALTAPSAALLAAVRPALVPALSLRRRQRLERVIERARVIPNGVDLCAYASLAPYRMPTGRPYLLGLGRLVPKKGFDLLLEAFSRIARQHPELDLLLVGDGPERSALERQINTLGLRDRVRLPGKAPARAIPSLLAGAELFLIPSRREPFGIVALEALAAGAPIVAAAVDGLPELLREGANGRLVPPSDPGALAAATLSLLDAPAERAAIRERNRRAAARYDWRGLAACYERLYREGLRHE